jgi:asparagine synthetase B (glutamine-hydrolysing)
VKLLELLQDAVSEACGEFTGCALSGGIDSSTVVCLSRRGGWDLPTFTGFYDEGPAFDERSYANLVKGKDHHEIEIRPGDVEECFDDMLAAFEIPPRLPGALGQYIVARYISDHVGTCLSGEGGDELFGGYARLMIVAGHPRPDGYENYVPPVGYPTDLGEALAYDYDRLPALLAVDDTVLGAFMVEARAPFTNQRVVDWVLAQPDRNRVAKMMLKEAVAGIVPAEILGRTDKKGMPVPFVKWGQGPLKDFYMDRLGYLPDPEKPWDHQWWTDLCA